jgi:RNA-directed DNA polymerase
VRKYRNKLVIKPTKDGLKALVQKTRECIKGMLGQKAETLIKTLSPIIRGWANHHRHVCSSEAFWTAERIIHYQLLRWARRTHPNKSYGWLKRKYFSLDGNLGSPLDDTAPHWRNAGAALLLHRPDSHGLAHQGQRRGQPL